MRTSILLLFLITMLNVNAQITLEHSFSNYVGVLDYNGQKYSYISNNTIHFYNDDYSFNSSITISPPYGYKMYIGFSNFTKDVFDLNSSYEFTCAFEDTLNNTGYLLKLYNENGAELKDFGNSFIGYLHTINGTTRFEVLRYTNFPYDYVGDIYSVPGNLTSIKTPKSIMEINKPYPIPADYSITIPYIIDKDEITELQIFNANGVIIETKKIHGYFDKILLNTQNYMPGIYFYRYKDITNKFIIK